MSKLSQRPIKLSRMRIRMASWFYTHEKLHLWHGMYSLLLLALALGRLVQKITTDSGGFASRYLPIFVVALLITGFIAYIRKTPIFITVFWLCVFWCMVIADIALLSYALYFLLGQMNLLIVSILLTLLLVTLPAQIALYRYSQRQYGVWA